jgi:hypothetical protein
MFVHGKQKLLQHKLRQVHLLTNQWQQLRQWVAWQFLRLL